MAFGARFLSDPSSFPDENQGTPWGDDAIALDLPGGPYRITGLDRGQRHLLEQHFGPLASADSAPAKGVAIAVFRTPAGTFTNLAPREYSLDIDSQHTAVRAAAPDFVGRMHWLPRPSGALWTSVGSAPAVSGLVENFVRLLAAFRILDDGAALLHSAALANGDGVCLFPGHSCAGKSTVCALGRNRGWQPLGDDLNVLSFAGDEPLVARFPRSADAADPVLPRAPLVAVCQLQQADTHEAESLTRITPGRALGLMLSCAPYVNLDPARCRRLEEILAAAALAVPAFCLSFARDSRLEPLQRILPVSEEVTS